MRLSGLGPGLAEPPRAITAPREATARRRVTWREKREEGMLLSSRLYRKLLVLVVATLAISALAAGPALAGKRVRVQQTGHEQCLVAPNPTTWGYQFWVVGSGFAPGLSVEIQVGGLGFFATADGNGSFSAWNWANFIYSGTETAYVYQMGDTRRTVLATCSFWANGLY